MFKRIGSRVGVLLTAFAVAMIPAVSFAQAELDFAPMTAELDGAKVAILAASVVLLVIWGIFLALRNGRAVKSL
jgi:hypothetical protein